MPRDPAAAQVHNLPAKPPEQISAGVCGMHGYYIGPACPKCVTQANLGLLSVQTGTFKAGE